MNIFLLFFSTAFFALRSSGKGASTTLKGSLKGHWQEKISAFYIKVFDLNSQNAVVRCYENAENTF